MALRYVFNHSQTLITVYIYTKVSYRNDPANFQAVLYISRVSI